MVIRFLRVQQTFGFINAFPINISRYRHSPEFCRFRSIIKITSLTKPHPISEIRTSVVNDRSFESFITILVNSIFNRTSVNQEFLIIRSLVPLFGFSILINYKIIIYQINRRKSLRPTISSTKGYFACTSAINLEGSILGTSLCIHVSEKFVFSALLHCARMISFETNE